MLPLILGGAAVHRCDNCNFLNTALQFAEKLSFMSGHRFSDAVSAFEFRCPFRGWQ
jgi:hypothetical protein